MKREVAGISVEHTDSSKTEAIATSTTSQHHRAVYIHAERWTTTRWAVARTCTGLRWGTTTCWYCRRCLCWRVWWLILFWNKFSTSLSLLSRLRLCRISYWYKWYYI